ncbi:hypothetical protein HZC21_01330 [Candidatus Peregrinibacteria bacterium]|nr:hypothetical protein [Candidatus Peregrinibacteria bacterium]
MPNTAPDLSRESSGPDFYDHGETLAAGILYMADTPENSRNKAELLPEMTAFILEKAYKEDGCTDEIKASAFKQFVRNHLRTDGWKKLETIFNEVVEQKRPVFAGAYLLDLYKKLKAEFEKQFEEKVFTGKPVEDTAAGTGKKAKAAGGLELDPGTKAQLGFAQVEPKRDIGGRGTTAWPMRK